MASSSRKCSDEELVKARADLRDYISRNPIMDEYKFRGPKKEEYMKEKEKGKNKKTKRYRLQPEEVQMVLSIKCDDPVVDEPDYLDELKEDYKDLRILVRACRVFMRRLDDDIRAGQEKIRQEILTKGYFTYEATDDEDEEEAVVPAAPFSFMEVPEAPQGARGGGRRRHRPGIMKSAGGVVKKLN